MKQLLVTTVNGQRIERYVDPSMRLVDFLRDELLLTGTKIGCKQGECGACTIIMNSTAVLSCIMPVMRAMDAEILTIEGLEKMASFIYTGRVHQGGAISAASVRASLWERKRFSMRIRLRRLKRCEKN